MGHVAPARSLPLHRASRQRSFAPDVAAVPHRRSSLLLRRADRSEPRRRCLPDANECQCNDGTERCDVIKTFFEAAYVECAAADRSSCE